MNHPRSTSPGFEDAKDCGVYAAWANRSNTAAEVGYRSGNKFYARLRRYTDVTPSDVRRMTEPEFVQLLEDRVSLRKMREFETNRGQPSPFRPPIAGVGIADRQGWSGVSLSGARWATDAQLLHWLV